MSSSSASSRVLAVTTGAPAARPAFDEVYAEFLPFVWRCLRGLGVPPGQLDDAVQDVFVVVHRNLGGFVGKSRLQTWLYGIARRVAFNHRRRRARKERTEPLDVEPESLERDPEALAEDREAARFLAEFMSTLKENRREVFLLAVVEQWSAPEVAEALEVPLNTVYSRLRAARLEFHAALAQRQENHGRP